MRRAASFAIDHPWVPILVALGVLGILWIKSTRSQEHEVRAAFSSAVSLSKGLDVRVDGIDAGKVTSVEYENGQAIVGLGVDDPEVWPLHEGTQARLNWGTTVGNGTRFVSIVPGPEDAPEIPDGGIIPAEQTISPVEVDDVFNTFDARTRDRLRILLANTAVTLDGRERELADALARTPDAMEASAGLFAELISDEAALRQLVADTSSTTAVLASEAPEIREIVSGMAAAMDEFATNEAALRADIEKMPATLAETRTTLARLDSSVTILDGLVADVGPGADDLRRLAVDARPTLARLRSAVPEALGLIDAFDEDASGITRLSTRATKLARNLDPLFADLAPMVACIRPYSPEIAGFLNTWASFTKNYDSAGHYARVRVNLGAHNAADYPPIDTDDFLATTGYTYAYPRPPGIGGSNEGKPFFLPKCGIGPEALDPSQDPEDG